MLNVHQSSFFFVGYLHRSTAFAACHILKLQKLASEIFVSIQSLLQTITSHPRKWEAYRLFETFYKFSIDTKKFNFFISILESLSEIKDREIKNIKEKLKIPFISCDESQNDTLKKWHAFFKLYYEHELAKSLKDEILFFRIVKLITLSCKMTSENPLFKGYFFCDLKLENMIEKQSSCFLKTLIKIARFALNIGPELFFLGFASILSFKISFQAQQKIFKILNDLLEKVSNMNLNIDSTEDERSCDLILSPLLPLSTSMSPSLTISCIETARELLTQTRLETDTRIFFTDSAPAQNEPTTRPTHLTQPEMTFDTLFIPKNIKKIRRALHPDRYQEDVDKKLATELFKYYSKLVEAHKATDSD